MLVWAITPALPGIVMLDIGTYTLPTPVLGGATGTGTLTPGVRGTGTPGLTSLWAGADDAKPKSSTTAATAINSIERFIDLDLLQSLDIYTPRPPAVSPIPETRRFEYAIGLPSSCVNTFKWKTTLPCFDCELPQNYNQAGKLSRGKFRLRRADMRWASLCAKGMPRWSRGPFTLRG
jgi:hypothetical protein